MPNHIKQYKVLDMPLFRPPDHHRMIWKSLSNQQLSQLMRLMSKMLMEYQKLQEGDCRE